MLKKMAFEIQLYINLCFENITKTLCRSSQDSKSGRLKQNFSAKNLDVKFLGV